MIILETLRKPLAGPPRVQGHFKVQCPKCSKQYLRIGEPARIRRQPGCGSCRSRDIARARGFNVREINP